MTNIFDQFDAPQAAPKQSAVNVFDQFDAPSENTLDLSGASEIQTAADELSGALPVTSGTIGFPDPARPTGTPPGVNEKESAMLARLSARLRFARDDGQRERIIEQVTKGEGKIVTDKNGLKGVQIGDRTFRLSGPVTTAENIITESSILAPFGAIGSGIGRVAGGLGRALGAGAGLTVGSGVQDTIAEGDPSKINIERALLTGAFGVVGEGGAQVASKLGPQVVDAVRSVLGRADLFQNGQVTARGAQVLEQAGVDPQSLTPAAANELQQLFRTGVDPQAALRQAEARSLPEPTTLTRGQATQDPLISAQESFARQAGQEETRNLFRASEEAQLGAINQNVDTIASQLAGGRAVSPGQGTKAAQAQLVDQLDQVKAQVNQAFQVARNNTVAVPSDALPALGQSIVRSVQDFPVSDLPNASSALSRLERLFQGGSQRGSVQLNNLEQWRRQVTTLANNSASKADSEALRRIRSAYDDAIEGNVSRALIEGDRQAVDAWRKAVKLRGEQGKIFESGDVVKLLTETLPDGSGRLKVDPDDARKVLFGASGLTSKRSLQRDVQKIKQVLGADSPEWNGLRADAFLQLVGRQNGQTFNASQFRNNFNNALRDSPEAMSILFNREEINLLRQFSNVVSNIVQKPQTLANFNPSGTAIVNFMKKAESSFGGLGSFVAGQLQRHIGDVVRQRRAASTASSAVGGQLPRQIIEVPGGLGGAAAATTAQ